MIIAVDGAAQEAVARLSEADKRSDPWSDWDILQCQEFYELEGRVAALETGAASGPIESEANPLRSNLEEALERIADLEGRAPGGYVGGNPRVHQQQRGRSSSAMDSKAIVALGPLTDDKNSFRQWDLKLTNAMSCVKRGYGDALDWLKEAIDRGEDPEDARPGASSEIGSARFGTVLIENLRQV